MGKLTNPTSYPTERGYMYPIKRMTTGYIKNQIEYIEATEVNKEYLSALKREYNSRTLKTFKLLP